MLWFGLSIQAKLEKLNNIVWPEIWRLVQDQINLAHSEGYRVCVVDAAVMLMAGWQKYVHEIWVTIATEKEVCIKFVAITCHTGTRI